MSNLKEAMRGSETAMTEKFQEIQYKKLSERSERAIKLLETWEAEVPQACKGLSEAYSKNQRMVENTIILIENTAKHLSKFNETQISSQYNGLTPENVLRTIRLGYANSNRGVAFYEFAMESERDGMWYLSPVYATSKRDATAEQVTHESSTYRYSTLEEIELPTQTPNSAITVFTGVTGGNLDNPPLRPYTVRVYETLSGESRKIIAEDDGNGTLLGAALDTGGTNTVDYISGAITITYTTAPVTGTVIEFSYIYDYEDPSQYTDLGEVELRLNKIMFDLQSYRLGLSWSKHSELTLSTTLNIDAEEAMVKAASEELKRSLDFQAFKLGYYVARGNGNFKVFDTDYLSKGVDSPEAHAQTLDRVIEDAADDIRNELNRGGYSSIVCGSQAANYISSYMKKFSYKDADAQEVGVYRIGSYANKPILKACRSDIIAPNEMYTVWNNAEYGDMAIGFGVLLPMYYSPKIEYKNMNSEMGLAEWGSHKVLNSKYIRGIRLTNLSNY